MHDAPAQESQPRSMFSAWIGVVLLFAFFGLLVLVVMGISPRGNRFEKKRAEERARKLQAVREETTKALTTYAWVDQKKGIVRIPITDAMKMTVAELAQKKPVPAYPIAIPSASPSPQSAGASSGPSPTAHSSETAPPASTSRNQPPPNANPPPPIPPQTQPGPSAAPAAPPASVAIKSQKSPAGSPSPSASGTPQSVRGKTP